LLVTARAIASGPAGWVTKRHVEDHGHHESAGGLALVRAVEWLASGEADEILVLGVAPDRGHAFLLSAPPSSPST
jgi:hypothetical protein